MERFRINQDRCVNHYKSVRCDLCEEICPQKAVSCLKISEVHCNACGLCLAICPVRAIESTLPYQEEVTRILTNDIIVLKCQKQEKDSLFPCLGFLDSRMLWAMAQEHQVILDLNHCRDCNSFINQTLHDRVIRCNDVLQQTGKTFIDECCKTDAYQGTIPVKKISRKDFFKQLMGAAFTTVETLAFPIQNSYAPYQTENYVKQQFHQDISAHGNPLFLTFQIKNTCNACGLCAKICPQQALQGEILGERFHLQYETVLCYHCKVCEKSCPQSAIQIVNAGEQDEVSCEWQMPLPVCPSCQQPFQPIGNNNICLTCFRKLAVFDAD